MKKFKAGSHIVAIGSKLGGLELGGRTMHNLLWIAAVFAQSSLSFPYEGNFSAGGVHHKLTGLGVVLIKSALYGHCRLKHNSQSR